ncbi:uncharacterized protein LOC113323117 isoform X2 [Papaver somniferum]|uniref:uncharacterized protein LOC113323117 isoform X2 n=1 Tax=Papaver somniferum TaxID=3469 RepID=UPI000E6FF782|nr:uncharacterized protein LOC113323117 isoform X2 [Papaver somniferum]
MSSAIRESGDDHNHQSHEEIIEMKSLLKMLVESQNKQAESLAKLADSQANTQQQIIEILKTTNRDGNKQKQKEMPGEDTASASTNKQETAQVPDLKHEQQGLILVPSVNKLIPEDTAGTRGAAGEQEIEKVSDDDDDDEEPELEGGSEAYYVPGLHNELYEALKDNDLEKATEYLNNNPKAYEEGIAYDKSTVLHMAICWSRKKIIEDIVNRMPPDGLGYKRSSNHCHTALHLATFRGYTKVAKMMVDKNSILPQIRDEDRWTPLEYALSNVSSGQKEIVKYLYSVTRDVEPSPFSGQDGARLLCNAIDANFYDLSLCLVKRFPKLITKKSKEHEMCGLELLVRKPFSFRSGTKLTWWQDRIYSLIQVNMNSAYIEPVEPNTSQTSDDILRKEGTNAEATSTNGEGILMRYLTQVPLIKKIYNQKLMNEQVTSLLKQMLVELQDAKSIPEIIKFFQSNPEIIKVAIKHGIIEFVVECLELFDYLIWEKLPDQRMIEMAIAQRNVSIVSLICDHSHDGYGDRNGLVSTLDDDENTILHYAAKIAPSVQLNLVSGVALQVQRELQWLKGVESIMSEDDKFKRNKEGYTAQFVFTTEHKELLKEAEDWMKDTSGSCMIVAALIATVAFAAAFTVPGGNISDTSSIKNGAPVFLGKDSFTVFAVADAFALFSSITSVLMFLAIYTSRYAEMDFLKSLPQKLIIGLATLFTSMAAILVAFCASLFIVVGNKGLIPIVLFGCVPVVLFAWLQLPLFYEMVRSTYWGSLLQKHKYMDPTNEEEEENDNKTESIVIRAKKLISSCWSP